MIDTHTIVFVHGFMNTPNCWRDWLPFFRERGYTCHAPAWPYHDGDTETLRQHPDPKLADTTLQDVLAHYEHHISKLPENPILIGHSLGGLIVQKLLERGCGAAAVCISSAPPHGIFAWHKDFLLSNLQLLNPFSRSKLCLMPPAWFHRYVTNEMSATDTGRFVRQNCVPAGKNVPKTIAQYGKIDFARAHKPMLFIAGSTDKSQPPVINRKNFAAYTDRSSIRRYREFAGRTHNILQQQGWQEVAQFAADWLTEIQAV